MDISWGGAIFAVLLLVFPIIVYFLDRKFTVRPIEDVNLAILILNNYKGSPDKFKLIISNSLQDPQGINMAIIGDTILKKGWFPDSFIQKKEYRIYKYMTIEEFNKRNANHSDSPNGETP